MRSVRRLDHRHDSTLTRIRDLPPIHILAAVRVFAAELRRFSDGRFDHSTKRVASEARPPPLSTDHLLAVSRAVARFVSSAKDAA